MSLCFQGVPDTAFIQERETWRVVGTYSVHSDTLSLSSCTSSLCISPSLPLHLWRLMGAWLCTDISLLSFSTIAFIFSAFLPRLSISDSLFLSSTGQSGFVTLRGMCICWSIFLSTVCMIRLSQNVCSDTWYIVCLQSEGTFNTCCC